MRVLSIPMLNTLINNEVGSVVDGATHCGSWRYLLW